MRPRAGGCGACAHGSMAAWCLLEDCPTPAKIPMTERHHHTPTWRCLYTRESKVFSGVKHLRRRASLARTPAPPPAAAALPTRPLNPPSSSKERERHVLPLYLSCISYKDNGHQHTKFIIFSTGWQAWLDERVMGRRPGVGRRDRPALVCRQR
jgi:hypothetical protein